MRANKITFGQAVEELVAETNLLAEMAFNRREFKDQLEHKLIGAILHFYQVQSARANGLSKWTLHWGREADRSLKEFRALLYHPVRGFRDRRKAAMEVLDIMLAADANYRRGAQNTVMRDYKLRLKEPIPDGATDKFHRRVIGLIDDALGDDDKIGRK